MTIEKRPSGNYRVRKMVNGKSISVTFDHKPTNKEILLAFTDKMNEKEAAEIRNMTFAQASKKYVESKKNVLSPNTYREYEKMCGRFSDWFTSLQVDSIEQVHINKQINELSIGKSPKTVRNYHGFISAVLGTFRPDMNINTTLPQKRKEEAYIPSHDDIKKILTYVKGTEYYEAYILACYGLRRSEILAIVPEDIDGDILHIRRAMALDSDRKWVTKGTKTTESTRDIIIPSDVAKTIKERGYVFSYHPNKLSRRLNFVQDKLGIPRFGIHKMRHYFASALSSQGVPDADIMALGGWKTDNVMKTVYRHSMLQKEEDRKRDVLKVFQTNLS